MTTTSTKSDLLTTKEAAAYVRVSASTLERLRMEGTGPRFYKISATRQARVLYRIADLDAWLAGQIYVSTSDYQRHGR